MALATSRYSPSGYEQQRLIEVEPKAIPATSTDEVTFTVRIVSMQIANPTASPITIRVSDKQATPIDFIPAGAIVPPNGWISYEAQSAGRLMPGGINWQAGGTGLHGYIQAVDP